MSMHKSLVMQGAKPERLHTGNTEKKIDPQSRVIRSEVETDPVRFCANTAK